MTPGPATVLLRAEKIEQWRIIGVFRARVTIVILTDPNTREGTTVRQCCPLAMAFDIGIVGPDVQHATWIRAEFFATAKHATL